RWLFMQGGLPAKPCRRSWVQGTRPQRKRRGSRLKMPGSQPTVLPLDDYNQTLINNTHPSTWKNPEPKGRYNLVIIGAGTAGLVSAAGAAALGARVALIERHLMGGDCLVYGCVPSKALIRASRAAYEAAHSGEFG